MAKLSRKQAFTIIELLITVSIISLLLAAAAFSIWSAIRNHRDAIRVGDVISIARAVDASAAKNHGLYPKNTNTSGSDTNAQHFCAQGLLNPANSNQLDASQFKDGQVPFDPAPGHNWWTPTDSCSNYMDGYTYHTEFFAGSSLSASTTDCTTNYLAICQNVDYTIEVGLENDRASGDNTPLQSPADLGLTSRTPPYISEPTNGRWQFLLNGPSCGTNCFH